MDRREAITRVGWLLGGTIIGANIFLETGCTPSPKQVNDLFSQDEVNLLNEIADTILPETSSPGAKAAKVGDFMAVMVKDCYKPEDQRVFLDGLDKLSKSFKSQYGEDFIEGDPKHRTAFLTALDVEQKEMESKKEEDASHYFRMMKELTLLGFFTSEAGATKALRYIAIPGKYDSSIPYKKGDRAWAI